MTYTCEEQVLKTLGISTFRNITEKQFRSYILLTNDIEGALRNRIIRQNPGLIFLMAGFIRHLTLLYKETFSIQPGQFEPIIDALTQLRQNIECLGQKSELSDAQIKSIADSQCMLANLYDDVDHKAYIFLSKIVFGLINFGFETFINFNLLVYRLKNLRQSVLHHS